MIYEMANNIIANRQYNNSRINNISDKEVTERLDELNYDTPLIYTTSLIKDPQEITLRTAARNNIMLEQLLANQEMIIKNQMALLEKQVKQMDVNA